MQRRAWTIRLERSSRVIAGTDRGLNIIVNEDGFGFANVREQYRALNVAGTNTWLIAPVENQSSSRRWTKIVFTTARNLTAPPQYGLLPAVAPSFGTEPNESHVWYYNGTPAAMTVFTLDYVVKNY
ncbi:MAG: hypothetical protein M1832_002141 [Thelocarpon impressellum]|nr:MAG: hypothetical protein M1832_002141 [Thelocarpon impressellum]